MPKINSCPWCKFKKDGICKSEPCDFLLLPYEKEAILRRIKELSFKVSNAYSTLCDRAICKDPERTLYELVDIQLGMAIMADRLMKDFGMSLEEIKKQASYTKMGFTEKARLLSLVGDIKRSQRRRRLEK